MRPLPEFPSKAFLAPMAGLSDPALRLVCKELGAGLVLTEFINIHAIVARGTGEQNIQDFIEFSDKEKPLSCQLFGSNLEALEKAVKIVSPYFDIIDYNMGCPAPHITQQMACSALLREPELTSKIRSGVTKSDKWKEIAKIAEEEGLSMITLHPRTVKQGYSGKADWKLIKELKQTVNIPVCGNGDIETPEDAKRMLDETGCDYVMVGRGAARNPFLFTQINQFLKTKRYKPVTPKDRIKYFLRYLSYSKRYKTIKFSSIRMQTMNFTKGIQGSKELRGQIIKIKNIKELELLIKKFYNSVKKL